MKVWIIQWVEYDEIYIQSVWDSEEGARKELERLQDMGYGGSYYLDDFEVKS